MRHSPPRSANCREATFLDKEAIAERLIAAGHPRARDVLTALLEDRLYVRNADQKIFIVKTTEGEPASYDLVEPLSLADAGSAPPDTLTKIGTNNRLRRSVRTALARFGLSSADATVRLAAIKDMLQIARRADRRAASRTEGRRNRHGGSRRHRHRPGDGGSGRIGSCCAPRGHRRRCRAALARMYGTSSHPLSKNRRMARSSKAMRRSGRPQRRRSAASTTGGRSTRRSKRSSSASASVLCSC